MTTSFEWFKMVTRRNVWRIVKVVWKRKKITNHHLRIVRVNYKEWGYAKNWIIGL